MFSFIFSWNNATEIFIMKTQNRFWSCFLGMLIQKPKHWFLKHNFHLIVISLTTQKSTRFLSILSVALLLFFLKKIIRWNIKRQFQQIIKKITVICQLSEYNPNWSFWKKIVKENATKIIEQYKKFDVLERASSGFQKKCCCCVEILLNFWSSKILVGKQLHLFFIWKRDFKFREMDLESTC